MLRAIQFPMHTASENKYRRQHAMVSASKTRKQRADVRLFLRQLSTPQRVVDGALNRFDVKLIRIAVAELDYSNLVGALKGVQDEVAEWIGLDDRDPLFRWDFLQQPCKMGFYGVRIEVRDLEKGEDKIVVLGAPTAVLGAPAQSSGRGRPRAGADRARAKKPRTKPLPVPAARLGDLGPPPPPVTLTAPAQKQKALAFVRSAAILPWQQTADELELTELPAFENIDPAPARAHVRAPNGDRVVITRRGRFDVEGLGMTWLFAPESAAFDPATWGLERNDRP